MFAERDAFKSAGICLPFMSLWIHSVLITIIALAGLIMHELICLKDTHFIHSSDFFRPIWVPCDTRIIVIGIRCPARFDLSAHRLNKLTFSMAMSHFGFLQLCLLSCLLTCMVYMVNYRSLRSDARACAFVYLSSQSYWPRSCWLLNSKLIVLCICYENDVQFYGLGRFWEMLRMCANNK